MKTLLACIALLSIAYPLKGSVEVSVLRDTSLPAGPGYDLSPMWDAPFPYRGIIEMEAKSAGVPAWILAGVISYESGWDKQAVNRNANGSTDLGIAQLNDRYLEYFAWKFNGGELVDPSDPAMSIRIAARYLALNYKTYGDWHYAVAAYNCGPGRARTRPWPQATERYVKEVFR